MTPLTLVLRSLPAGAAAALSLLAVPASAVVGSSPGSGSAPSPVPAPRCETGEPRCPGIDAWGIGYVCRRPCPEGGYFYQFGSNCMDGSEPAPGRCVYEDERAVYRPGTSLAVMEPGARRPGETHHTATFQVTWDCRAPIGPGGAVPAPRAFTFTYGRPPWGHGSYRDEDAFFGSREWNRFVASLPESVDTVACLDSVRLAIHFSFSQTCKIVEVAAGQTSDRAREQCRTALRDRYALPMIARIARRQGEIGARATVPMLLPGAPLAADDSNARDLLVSLESKFSGADPACRWGSTFNLTEARALVSSDFADGGHLEALARNTPQRCRGAVLVWMLDALADLQPIGCRSAPERADCRRVREATAGVLREWIRAFGADEGDPLHAFAARESEYLACFRSSDRPASLLRDLELALRFADRCVELGYRPTPQSAVVDERDVGTGLSAGYRLTRASRDLYRVELNLTFTPESVREDKSRQVDRCFRETNPLLKGPGSQRLEFVRTTSSDVPENDIEVMDRPTRSNSSQWSSRINCRTIIHEVMHLLGLVDEYRESWSGALYDPDTGSVRRIGDRDETPARDGETFLPEYSCRVTGPDDSLMSDQSEAFGAVRGLLGLGVFTSRDSLLYPAHFRAITQPGCSAANRLYYRCAVRAYETGYSSLGDGCTRGLDPSCRSGSEDWLQ